MKIKLISTSCNQTRTIKQPWTPINTSKSLWFCKWKLWMSLTKRSVFEYWNVATWLKSYQIPNWNNCKFACCSKQISSNFGEPNCCYSFMMSNSRFIRTSCGSDVINIPSSSCSNSNRKISWPIGTHCRNRIYTDGNHRSEEILSNVPKTKKKEPISSI